MRNKRIPFGIYGSFCNHAAALKQLTTLCERSDVTAVISENVYACSTRFFNKDVPLGKVEDVTKYDTIHTTAEAEKVGPANVYDITVITPMTATVAAEMAHGIYDYPVTLSAEAMIRSQRNIVFGIATNDGLGIGGVSIFSLISTKHFYIIPSRQDTPFSKGRSIVSDQELMGQTVDQALNNGQPQPILLGSG